MVQVWKPSYYTGVMLPLWVNVDSSSPLARQVAPFKVVFWSCDLHVYRVELLACGSAIRMCHLSVALSVEFADDDTAKKVYY